MAGLAVSKQMTFTLDQFSNSGPQQTSEPGVDKPRTTKPPSGIIVPTYSARWRRNVFVFMYYQNVQDWYSECGKCDGTGPYRSFRAEFFLCLSIE